jgi:hypothetical protein
MSLYEHLVDHLKDKMSITGWTIADGIEKQCVPSAKVQVMDDGRGHFRGAKTNVAGDKGELSPAQLQYFFQLLEDLWCGENYRNVKTNQAWKDLYGKEDVVFKKINNGVASLEAFESVACRECHIVLPLRNLTVDHQQPQAGGAIGALCRFFRAVGYTKDRPTGNKGKDLLARHAGNAGGDTVAASTSEASRYTLNYRGIIIYSVFRDANKLEELKRRCMHSFVNLRPVCGSCNSSLKNNF